jgi:hypothetical protein
MICLLISIIASSLSLVNANDNLISHNDSFEFTHRKLDTEKSGNKNESPPAKGKSKQSTDSNKLNSSPS